MRVMVDSVKMEVETAEILCRMVYNLSEMGDVLADDMLQKMTMNIKVIFFRGNKLIDKFNITMSAKEYFNLEKQKLLTAAIQSQAHKEWLKNINMEYATIEIEVDEDGREIY